MPDAMVTAAVRMIGVTEEARISIPPFLGRFPASHCTRGRTGCRGRESLGGGAGWHRLVPIRPDLLVLEVEQHADVVLRVEVHGADPRVAGTVRRLQVGPGVGADIVVPGDRVVGAAELRLFLA